MRLIDADKLEEAINSYLNTGRETFSPEIIREAIDSQPTAFDVDKVVEQLEKLADKANDKILEDGGLQLYYDGYEDAMRTAVKIVKGGEI